MSNDNQTKITISGPSHVDKNMLAKLIHAVLRGHSPFGDAMLISIKLSSHKKPIGDDVATADFVIEVIETPSGGAPNG